MSKTIDTEDYCRAFETWVALPGSPMNDAEKAIVQRGCAHLREHFPGAHPVDSLCGSFREAMGRGRDASHLLIAIAKSCLLHRLIYGGEALRTRPCPLHRGEWSGWSFTVCPHGCSYGPNLTGWLP